jgi:formylglycine-generating enzyme required for sulfatase activity
MFDNKSTFLRKTIIFLFLCLSASLCAQSFLNHTTFRVNDKELTVAGVPFKMIAVQGGTFLMGATLDQYRKSRKDEYPVRRVAVNTFYMGETEVTQELWKAVMGQNISANQNPKAPVEMVSWNDCQLFIEKLNQLTGMAFRLPTEAEWEFAARGGAFSGHWLFAGDDFLDGLGWFEQNASTSMPVKQKLPNEIGLYDMSGNVAEWCSDWYGDYAVDNQSNPAGPDNGEDKCVRGGHWKDANNSARVAVRSALNPILSNNFIGLRLVADIAKKDIEEAKNNPIPQIRHFDVFDSSFLPSETISVNGVDFNMIGVQGGSFLMGATLEQTKYADVDEQPCHNVAVSSFRMAETEVTQKLWTAVMGDNPSNKKGDNLPVYNVSWNDCQTFISKLNDLTGKQFRLPTEAEWEYAARGGNLSMQYAFPGSDACNEVAWNAFNCKFMDDVAKLKPNELNIFDMAGNIAEWCQDWYAPYTKSDSTNPCGPNSGNDKVVRGSHWEDGQKYCHCSYRSSAKPTAKNNHIGLRLAL